MSTPTKPLTSTERVERLSHRSPKDDENAPDPTIRPFDPETDDPAPAPLENDRGITDRYGWQP
jgi:hypothetical protein